MSGIPATGETITNRWFRGGFVLFSAFAMVLSIYGLADHEHTTVTTKLAFFFTPILGVWATLVMLCILYIRGMMEQREEEDMKPSKRRKFWRLARNLVLTLALVGGYWWQISSSGWQWVLCIYITSVAYMLSLRGFGRLLSPPAREIALKGACITVLATGLAGLSLLL